MNRRESRRRWAIDRLAVGKYDRAMLNAVKKQEGKGEGE